MAVALTCRPPIPLPPPLFPEGVPAEASWSDAGGGGSGRAALTGLPAARRFADVMGKFVCFIKLRSALATAQAFMATGERTFPGHAAASRRTPVPQHARAHSAKKTYPSFRPASFQFSHHLLSWGVPFGCFRGEVRIPPSMAWRCAASRLSRRAHSLHGGAGSGRWQRGGCPQRRAPHPRRRRRPAAGDGRGGRRRRGRGGGVGASGGVGAVGDAAGGADGRLHPPPGCGLAGPGRLLCQARLPARTSSRTDRPPLAGRAVCEKERAA